MLQPYERTGLYDALRPPAGYHVDQAVGTSFTLDLEALLTAPVAFAIHDADLDTDASGVEPVGLLEAIRRNADRITLFCQAGQVSVPGRHRVVFSWLEDTVAPVRPPNAGGLFHPKVWVVRYLEPTGERAILRVLCATRNLTFDTSWDTLLAVETDPYPTAGGPAGARPNGAPLAGLLRSIGAWAVTPLSDARAVAVRSLADDLERAWFAAPAPFNRLRFEVLDGSKTVAPVESGAIRLAVVAPFVEAGFLSRLLAGTEVALLVSRDEALQRLDAALLGRVGRVATLVPSLDLPPEEVVIVHGAEELAAAPLHGNLHAKLYVADTPTGSRVTTGSANATAAAFTRNVEVLAVMDGPREHGVAALLEAGPKGVTSFASLLVDHEPNETIAPPPADEVARAVERYRRMLGSCQLEAHVAPAGDDHQVRLTSFTPLPDAPGLGDLEVTVRPITVGPQSVRTIRPGALLDVTFSLSLEGLTAFFVLSVEAGRRTERVASSTLVKVPLIGAPPDRHSRLLASLLRDPDRLLRYLLLLLADDSLGGADTLAGTGAGSWLGSFGGGSWNDAPLVELLVRAVDRFPDRLDHIDALLRDLAQQRQEVLPPGFEEIWDAVWATREELKG